MPRRAALYSRMSTESQSYSIQNQKAALSEYAATHDYEIVKSYEDPGVSGLSLKRRRGLRQLLRDVLSRKAPFSFILVYDVSRWGRFQDVDEAAHYEFLCRKAGIQVVYCAEQFVNDGTLSSDLMKAIKRTMAGEYSRELSVKVAMGQKRMAALGYWMHSRAPYGFRRMVVSPTGQSKGLLSAGEHKFKTDRVILVPGSEIEQATVRSIFTRFLKRNGRSEFTRIANELNADGSTYSTGAEWNRNDVRRLLTNPVYAGYNVWGRRTKKLSGAIVDNPEKDWTMCPRAYTAIVSPEVFEKTQTVIVKRWHRRTDAELLAALKSIYRKNGHLTRQLMLHSPAAVAGPSSYQARFGTLTNAYRLVGYEPPSKTVLSAQSHSASWSEKNELANKLCAIFPTRVTIARNKESERPCLRLDTQDLVAVLTCRSARRSGRNHWITWRGQASNEATLLLIGLYNTDNSALSAFYLADAKLLPTRLHRFRKEHPLLKQATRLPDLFAFYEVARKLLRERV